MIMQTKHLPLLFFLVFSCGAASAQDRLWSKITINSSLQDTFSFKKNWEYAWYMIKHRNGKFEKITGTKITPADKERLYFTAGCSTNVQGEHNINYCTAEQDTSEIRLRFVDGKPAYSNQFVVHLKGDSFYFETGVAYKMAIPGYSITYRVTKQQLVMNKTAYELNDKMLGYIDVEFTETTSHPQKETIYHYYYLRGYFSTPLKLPQTKEF
jgi:hypothetical protein